VERIRTDPAIKGAVLTSGKSSGFCAGADLAEMAGGLFEERAAGRGGAAQRVRARVELSRNMRALETCGKPVAAAINGLALGGGFELTLACHHRVLADDSKAQVGLPEVKVGLLPGSGGTQRLPRLMGAQAALMLITEGKSLRPKEALGQGLVHAVVPADQVVETAKAWVREKGDPVAPWDKKEFKVPGGMPYSPQGAQIFIVGNAMLRKQSYGNYPAVLNIMKCVYEGLQVPMDAALRIEARYFVKTLMTPQAKAMIRSLFLGMQELNKGAGGPRAWRRRPEEGGGAGRRDDGRGDRLRAGHGRHRDGADRPEPGGRGEGQELLRGAAEEAGLARADDAGEGDACWR
jgi:3-hydroxyacyl-CoA dehydrogenase/enoyl-CoA hydratase/3-hydroxybutyryl-CoA epimerase